MKTLEDQKTEALIKMYTQKPLTDVQISDVFFQMTTERPDGSKMTADEMMVAFARAIEKAHGIE
jgi:hypothetical protein